MPQIESSLFVKRPFACRARDDRPRRARERVPAGRRVVAGSGWLDRSAGVRGVSRPRRFQCRSPVALPGPSTSLFAARAAFVVETDVDGVADPPFERPGRFLARLSFGNLALKAGVPRTVAMTDLGDRSHMDDVVEAPVAAPRYPAAAPRWPHRRTPRSAPCRCRRRSGHDWRKRAMSPTSPMTVAATIGPTPNSSVNGRLRCCHCGSNTQPNQ